MAIKSKYSPQNPEKYIGKSKEIIFKSLWERKYAFFLDTTKDVLKWSYEPFPIQYFSQIQKKITNYWPDFYVETRDNKFIIEIKPKKQTKPPKIKKNTGNPVKDKAKKYKYIQEHAAYITNKNKWDSAQKFCDDNGITFKIITEKDMGI